MLMFHKVVVGDAERALVYKDRRLERVLSPGVHRLRGWSRKVVMHDITTAEYTGSDTDSLVQSLGASLDEHFQLVNLDMQEAGLVYKHGKLVDVLQPGARKLYWKGLAEVVVQRVALSGPLELAPEIVHRLRQLNLIDKLAVAVTVPAESAGLVFVDGKLVQVLGPGAVAYWNFRKNVTAEVIDLRVQSMEVSGQELLTRDKVSLRVNLAASLRVTDPVAARTRVAKYADFVYRELQYGLRKAVSAKTLDELLGDKASLDADIFAYVRGQLGGIGIELLGVGVKDVILPGEMKDILNGVVQAEKSAQANVIRRREEANATRSLLNTARLVEESPTLMRLKELEALEKVTEKIDKLTVFGGLDGLLNQLVKIKQ
ncbi:slipin family protein [Arenimonas sp. MALMAid1274]|uniref:slipin family protein n=1 Tax=Arenimonas sp. MALMAid1274 TaxID=3411630 RepID=UPI003BA3C19E